jgi:hypothetical protein
VQLLGDDGVVHEIWCQHIKSDGYGGQQKGFNVKRFDAVGTLIRGLSERHFFSCLGYLSGMMWRNYYE